MRKIALVFVLIAIVLSGCGNTAPVSTGPVNTTNTTDKDYTDFLSSHDPELGTAPEAMVVLAHKVCEGFDAGLNFDEVFAAVSNNFTNTQASLIIGTAVGAYCPWHQDVFSTGT
jgi:PBP1b-binding outer membrane lipoprotein LpoB